MYLTLSVVQTMMLLSSDTVHYKLMHTSILRATQHITLPASWRRYISPPHGCSFHVVVCARGEVIGQQPVVHGVEARSWLLGPTGGGTLPSAFAGQVCIGLVL